MSAHEISAPGNQHITADKLNKASADVIDAFMGLDVAQLWGDGSRVGADGTQIDTWDDNLLAETSIRYGGYGGIAYRHISDTYIALFSHFIPCGVWEAVFIFAGLLENESKMIVPEEIHADTQGQSLPAFGLAAMLGVELLPRIRNWKDLIFYRPNTNSHYDHIDTLFGPNEVIDSGRLMLDALINGERDPVVLAELAKRRLRSKIPQLIEALTGRFTEHHAFLARVHLDLIDQHSHAIDHLTARIDAGIL